MDTKLGDYNEMQRQNELDAAQNLTRKAIVERDEALALVQTVIEDRNELRDKVEKIQSMIQVERDAGKEDCRELRKEIEIWKLRADAHEQNYNDALTRIDKLAKDNETAARLIGTADVLVRDNSELKEKLADADREIDQKSAMTELWIAKANEQKAELAETKKVLDQVRKEFAFYRDSVGRFDAELTQLSSEIIHNLSTERDNLKRELLESNDKLNGAIDFSGLDYDRTSYDSKEICCHTDSHDHTVNITMAREERDQALTKLQEAQFLIRDAKLAELAAQVALESAMRRANKAIKELNALQTIHEVHVSIKDEAVAEVERLTKEFADLNDTISLNRDKLIPSRQEPSRLEIAAMFTVAAMLKSNRLTGHAYSALLEADALIATAKEVTK